MIKESIYSLFLLMYNYEKESENKKMKNNIFRIVTNIILEIVMVVLIICSITLFMIEEYDKLMILSSCSCLILLAYIVFKQAFKDTQNAIKETMNNLEKKENSSPRD